MTRKLQPDLNGQRFRYKVQMQSIWLTEGKLRHIPNQETFQLLFGDEEINEDKNIIDTISLGKPFADKTYLAKSETSEDIYLISPPRVKRLLNKAAMVKYHFCESKIKILAADKLDRYLKGTTSIIPVTIIHVTAGDTTFISYIIQRGIRSMDMRGRSLCASVEKLTGLGRGQRGGSY